MIRITASKIGNRDPVKSQQPSPKSEHDQASAQATLGRSLQPVRVVLSIAFVLVTLVTPGESVITLSAQTALLLAALAGFNALINAARFAGLLARDIGRKPMVFQIAVDSVIALISMLLLDASATPLAWIALLLPVFDAGVAFGAVGAGIGWASLSLTYVVVRLQTDPPWESGGSNVLGLAVQQLAAVAIVAIPTAYVAARLRDDLAKSHRARLDANQQTEELLGVAAAAQRLATTTDAVKVLEIAIDCVVAIGFARADVCEKNGDRPWRLLRAAGSHPGPRLGRHLDEAARRAKVLTIGVGGKPIDAEELRLLGYRAGVVLPITTTQDHIIVLRAWSSDDMPVDSSALESVKLVASLTAGAWQNATTLSDLESWSAELNRRATHDELTGLANRAYLFTKVDASLDRMRSTGVKFALLFLDLDGFKEVNDQLGHDAGDAVLQGIAERLGRQIRGQDLVARLGGDEFVVVLNDLADPKDATVIAERICEAAAAPFSIGGRMVNLGTSIGIAYARQDDTADSLINSADGIMYEAKRQGGNRFLVSRPDEP
jgi:diguanylate cyclase (GGDEF)-like protein